MAHRGTAHARRRTTAVRVARVGNGWGLIDPTTARSSGGFLVEDFDATTYDDVIPHRLRGTIRLDDDGEPASLVDLVADRRLI